MTQFPYRVDGVLMYPKPEAASDRLEQHVIPSRPLAQAANRTERPQLLALEPRENRTTEQSVRVSDIFDQFDRKIEDRAHVAPSSGIPKQKASLASLHRLPELLPPEPIGRTATEDRLSSVFRVVSDLEAEENSIPGKIAIYVLNSTIMVMSFPVGMGLLTYNILKGGRITATARTMAMTGVAIGFAETSFAQNFETVHAFMTLL
jgi:hypothetical protein